VRILIVALYFPPAGGAGVQRPLKLAAHLPDLGIETHVLAPDDPKWLHRDETLVVPPRAVVHRARNLGPAARRPAEELYGRRGLGRLGVHARLVFRRLLVPDASVLWNVTAIPAALRIVRRERIDVVLTTSPPGSAHLVGAAVKRMVGVPWVADLRDSIARHPHRRRDLRGEARLARLVAGRADAVVCATSGIAEEMRALGHRGRLAVIESGSDFDEFEGLPYRSGARFRITHTGSFFGRRDPRPFLDALARAPETVVARFVGGMRASDRAFAERLGLGDRVEVLPPVARGDALALQRDSEALLLLIPEAEGRGRAVLSGKVFEYLAAERPILAVVPPGGEAAALVQEVGAGTVVAPDDVEGMAAALHDLEARWRRGELDGTPLTPAWKQRLSRRARAEEYAEPLRGLA
jgi:glycosyltransferase involved in cell wall biosynthesis